MLRNFKTVAFAASVAAATLSLNAFAGGPELPPAPTMASGFFLGLGGGYGTEQLRSNFSVTSSSLDDANDPPTRITGTIGNQLNAQTYNLSPTVQLGYLSYNNSWMWGVGLMYSYLNSTTTSPVISPEADVSIGFANAARVQPENKLSLLFLLGSVLDDKDAAYLGVGPAVINVANRTNASAVVVDGDPDPDTNGTISIIYNRSVNQWAWGGSAQLGWLHYFGPTWFLSASYTYSLFQSRNYVYPTYSFQPLSQSISASRSIRTSSQQIVVAINKTFSL